MLSDTARMPSCGRMDGRRDRAPVALQARAARRLNDQVKTKRATSRRPYESIVFCALRKSRQQSTPKTAAHRMPPQTASFLKAP